jgi:hypothetical protein
MTQAPAPRAPSSAQIDGSVMSRLTAIGLVAGGIGVVGGVVLSSGRAADFYFAWLTSYLYFLSIALGAWFFVLSLFVCRAGWAVTARRMIENVMATLPVFIVLFIPIWIGRHDLYPWTDAAEVAKNPALQGKSGYLNETFFMIRALIYFACWGGLAVYFSGQSQKQDQTGDERITRRLQAVAAPGIIVFSLTITMAAVDWLMSLDPEWYSTMFGVYYFAGSLLSAFAFIVLTIVFAQSRGALQGVVTVEHLHDIGKLLFAFTVFWTYIAFCQYFLIWYGNIPEETAYFMERQHGSWPMIGKLLMVGHFVVPFFFLMPRATKRSPVALCLAAIWLLGMHFMDLFWCVMPAHQHEGAHFGPIDAMALLAVGGFFLAAFGWVSSRRALVPVGDPRLAESLSFENV